jgi:hypothetical protein
MTSCRSSLSPTRATLGAHAALSTLLLCSGCGMRTEMDVAGQGEGEDWGPGGAGAGGAVVSGKDSGSNAGSSAAGGSVAGGSGTSSRSSLASIAGGNSSGSGVRGGGGSAGGDSSGGPGSRGGAGIASVPGGGSSTGGRAASSSDSARGGSGGARSVGGSSSTSRDAGAFDSRLAADAMVTVPPTINPNSGYVTLATGSVTMSGYVSSYVGGSGSSISLSYNETSFCASGAVGASSTYNSWAGAGFTVNQPQSGAGSTTSLKLVGSSISVSYENKGSSRLELQLWDGSNYWCTYLPAAKGPNTVTVPLSTLNSKCWDGSGTSFQSGTPITAVQLVVPGNATASTPFDYCFLGLKVQ